jgi:hypothetical protein
MRIKEWADAGAVFTYTGAAASHLGVGDGAGALGPIGFAVMAPTSRGLGPSARRDLAPAGRPSPSVRARSFGAA